MKLQEKFWLNLNQIQNILLLDDGSLCRILDISKETFLKAKSKQRPIELERMDYLFDRLGITIDHFIEENYDIAQARERFMGEQYALPARYSYAKFSKSRTIINCLKYIELSYGSNFKNSILRSLQIDPRFFDNPERLMNINVLTDFCVLLNKLGLNKEDFVAMGKMSYIVNNEGPLGERLRSHRNVNELFEDICSNESKNFDLNFDYYITRVSNGSIHVGSRPTEMALEYLNHAELGSNFVCDTKLGVFGSFPQYLGSKASYAEKTRCMREGHSYYEYKINYSS